MAIENKLDRAWAALCDGVNGRIVRMPSDHAVIATTSDDRHEMVYEAAKLLGSVWGVQFIVNGAIASFPAEAAVTKPVNVRVASDDYDRQAAHDAAMDGQSGLDQAREAKKPEWVEAWERGEREYSMAAAAESERFPGFIERATDEIGVALQLSNQNIDTLLKMLDCILDKSERLERVAVHDTKRVPDDSEASRMLNATLNMANGITFRLASLIDRIQRP